MAAIDFPDLPVARVTFRSVANVQTFSSPLAGNTQIKELPGAHWRAEMTFRNLTPSEHATLFAFLAHLKGGVNQARVAPVGYARRGSLTSNCFVNGGSQVGDTLTVSGLPASQTGLLLEGDFIEVNGEFHQVRYGTQLDSDASGVGVIYLTHPIRRSPANGAAVEVLDPRATMIPARPDASISISPGRLGGTTIEMMEVFW
jgi:hypothetical protein